MEELLQLEDRLTSAEPSLERDAKLNLLKYTGIYTVKLYESAYDGLFYGLGKEGGLEPLRNITPVKTKGQFLQPKVCDVQGCEGGTADLEVEEQAEFYLADAKLAKPHLDGLIRTVVENLDGCEAHYVGIKSRESTVRKAKKSYGGNVRRVVDMTRVAVVCDTPERLEQVYMGIVGQLQVSQTIVNPHDGRMAGLGTNTFKFKI